MKLILDILPREGQEKEYDPVLLDQVREALGALEPHHHVEVYRLPDARMKEAIKEANSAIETLQSADMMVTDLRDHLIRLKERL
jgi:hypothetical protein